MSAYDRLQGVRPLPDMDEYEQAHVRFDRALGRGGAWAHSMHQAITVAKSPELRRQAEDIAKLGSMVRLEELSTINQIDSLENDAERVLVARAFGRGVLLQTSALRRLYDIRLNIEEVNNVMAGHYNGQDLHNFKTTPEDTPDERREKRAAWRSFNGDYIDAVSRYGEAQLSDASTGLIEKWSRSVYPGSNEHHLARAYRIGNFATIFYAEQHQELYNKTKITIAARDTDFDAEARENIFTGTGEDS